jgi:gliding motility-associated-like protein
MTWQKDKKYLYALFVVFFLVNTLVAQNLVLNPSFEITTSNCANFGGEGFTTDLVDWDDANSGADSCSSPDLFSACNLFATVMPNSILGYQQSRTGTRHAGFISHEALDEYREYIEGKLSTPMVAGQTYCVSFYISLANDVAYATNNIGVKFSNTLFQRNACPGQTNSLINLTPDLNYTCGPITDTTNWVRLQWDYTATGGEQFFVIGNFFNNANTNIVNNPGGGFTNPYAYYFIDDVSVSPNSCCFAEITLPESFCVNDAPQTLQVTTGTGSSCLNQITGNWSGNGIDAVTGIFNPSIAGIGSHVINFNTSCGYVATTTVVVSPCQSLEVCRENDGTYSVSNGVASYNWEYFVPATSTSITTQAQCQACGYTWFFGQCLNGIQPVTECSTPSSWTNFANGGNVSIPSGNNQIRVTDASGTSLSFDPALITNCNNDPCPTITISYTSITNATCFGSSNGAISLTSSGGVGTINYLTQPGSLNGSSLTNLTAQTYTVTATDQNSCTSTFTFVITQPTELTATTDFRDANCGASDGMASITVSGGTSPYNYSWNPSLGTGPIQNNIPSGLYTVEVRDANLCTITRKIAVNAINGPTSTITNQTNVSCFGAQDGSITLTSSGGTPPYTYNWFATGGNSATENNLPPGIYTCSISDNTGCFFIVNATITQPSQIIINDTTIINSTCGNSNGEITLIVSGGTGTYNYSWSNGQTTNPITNLSVGAYIVTVKDQNNCQLKDTFIVSGSQPLIISSIFQSVDCANNSNGSATFNISGGLSPYQGVLTPGNIVNTAFTNLSAGAYVFNLTDANNCSWDTTFTIIEPNEINTLYAIEVPKCGNEGAISVSVNGGVPPYLYLINGNINLTNQFEQLADGNYLIEIKDANNCINDTLISLASTDSVSKIIIPNIFTPNGDKINDLWEFKTNCISQISVELFNRWGNLIVSYDGIQKIWDGKQDGTLLSQGVYFYKIIVKQNGGKEETFIGTVTLQL